MKNKGTLKASMRRRWAYGPFNLLKKGAAALLLFSFICQPTAAVFAQETTPDVPPSSDSAPNVVPEVTDIVPTDTETPPDETTTPTEDPAPDETTLPTEETDQLSDEVLEEDLEELPGEEMLMSQDSTTIPNSPREVLQSVRNRVWKLEQITHQQCSLI